MTQTADAKATRFEQMMPKMIWTVLSPMQAMIREFRQTLQSYAERLTALTECAIYNEKKSTYNRDWTTIKVDVTVFDVNQLRFTNIDALLTEPSSISLETTPVLFPERNSLDDANTSKLMRSLREREAEDIDDLLQSEYSDLQYLNDAIICYTLKLSKRDNSKLLGT